MNREQKAEDGVAARNESEETKQELETKLLEAVAYLETIVQNLPNPFFTTDLDGRIFEFNRAAEKLIGYSADEVFHSHISLLLGEGFDISDFRELKADGLQNELEIDILTKEGSKIPIKFSLSVLPDGNGRPMGMSFILQDLTLETALQDGIMETDKRVEVLIQEYEQQVRELETEIERRENDIEKMKAEVAGQLDSRDRKFDLQIRKKEKELKKAEEELHKAQTELDRTRESEAARIAEMERRMEELRTDMEEKERVKIAIEKEKLEEERRRLREEHLKMLDWMGKKKEEIERRSGEIKDMKKEFARRLDSREKEAQLSIAAKERALLRMQERLQEERAAVSMRLAKMQHWMEKQRKLMKHMGKKSRTDTSDGSKPKSPTKQAKQAKPGSSPKQAKPGSSPKQAKPGSSPKQAKPKSPTKQAKPGSSPKQAKPKSQPDPDKPNSPPGQEEAGSQPDPDKPKSSPGQAKARSSLKQTEPKSPNKQDVERKRQSVGKDAQTGNATGDSETGDEKNGQEYPGESAGEVMEESGATGKDHERCPNCGYTGNVMQKDLNQEIRCPRCFIKYRI